MGWSRASRFAAVRDALLIRIYVPGRDASSVRIRSDTSKQISDPESGSGESRGDDCTSGKQSGPASSTITSRFPPESADTSSGRSQSLRVRRRSFASGRGVDKPSVRGNGESHSGIIRQTVPRDAGPTRAIVAGTGTQHHVDVNPHAPGRSRAERRPARPAAVLQAKWRGGGFRETTRAAGRLVSRPGGRSPLDQPRDATSARFVVESVLSVPAMRHAIELIIRSIGFDRVRPPTSALARPARRPRTTRPHDPSFGRLT